MKSTALSVIIALSLVFGGCVELRRGGRPRLITHSENPSPTGLTASNEGADAGGEWNPDETPDPDVIMETDDGGTSPDTSSSGSTDDAMDEDLDGGPDTDADPGVDADVNADPDADTGPDVDPCWPKPFYNKAQTASQSGGACNLAGVFNKGGEMAGLDSTGTEFYTLLEAPAEIGQVSSCIRIDFWTIQRIGVVSVWAKKAKQACDTPCIGEHCNDDTAIIIALNKWGNSKWPTAASIPLSSSVLSEYTYDFKGVEAHYVKICRPAAGSESVDIIVDFVEIFPPECY